MYLIRRTYTVQPGQARKAATLIDTIGLAYEAAGIRSASRVYFNSGTTPGDKNTVATFPLLASTTATCCCGGRQKQNQAMHTACQRSSVESHASPSRYK